MYFLIFQINYIVPMKISNWRYTNKQFKKLISPDKEAAEIEALRQKLESPSPAAEDAFEKKEEDEKKEDEKGEEEENKEAEPGSL